MIAMLVKLGISLVSILLLAGLSRVLKLGGDLRIRDADHARQIAEEQLCGFEAVDVAVDRAGMGALLRDAQGRQMLIRRHGAAFAGRLLDADVDARLDQDFLTIGTSDRHFGHITLYLGEAAASWAAGLRSLKA